MDYNKSMLIMLLLFSSLVFAEDMASEKYCFPSSPQVAQKKFAAIQVPSDVVTIDENCLVIQMRPHRRELIQRYMLSSIPGTSIAFSSEEVRREPCKLKVEKIRKKNSESVNVGYSNQLPTISEANPNGSQTETMEIQTQKDFELTVDQSQIKGSCRFINQNRYEIAIEVRKNLKPIVPVALPPGSIVVVNQLPPDQETSALQTQLQLSRGERVDLGGVIRNLEGKKRDVNINPSLNIETSDQDSSEKVFLSLQ